MNVEFLVHGTLSDGQSSWKNIDSDYCARFYTPTPTNVLMTCEVVKRDNGGLSSYYNYLRYNNLSAASGRSGAYFGLTIRIDDSVCCDVANMYNILDAIFNKRIVGTLLSFKNNTYFYTCESFKSKEAELKAIETSFFNMCNSIFFGGTDFVSIPSNYARKSGALNLHTDDVTSAIARDTLLAGNKLCVSPSYPTKQSQSVQQQIKNIQANAQQQILAERSNAEQRIKAVQDECNKQIQAKNQELNRINSEASSGKAQLRDENKQLRESLRLKDEEFEKLRTEYRSKELNTEINRTARELKEPILKLAGIMAERFPEVDNAHPKKTATDGKKDGKGGSEIFQKYKKEIIAAVVLLLVVAASAWTVMGERKTKDKEITALHDQIEQLEDQLKKIKDGSVAENDSVTAQPSPAQTTDGTTTYDFTKLKIDIVEKAANDEGLKKGKTYTFQVVGGEYPKDGKWLVNSSKLKDNKFEVKQNSGEELSIEYRAADGKKVGPRKIKVIE